VTVPKINANKERSEELRMSSRSKAIEGIAATLGLTVVAFIVGFIVSGWVCNRLVVPGLIREYPHDGQIGLAVAVDSFYGACALALIVFIVGIVWTVRRFRRDSHTA
jgi:hypothetical protein